jgi:hypothetical protein
MVQMTFRFGPAVSPRNPRTLKSAAGFSGPGTPFSGTSGFSGDSLKSLPTGFSLVGTRQHIRQDGTETVLYIWRGSCLVCWAGFEVATPAPLPDGTVNTKAFGRVHCDARKRKCVL